MAERLDLRTKKEKKRDWNKKGAIAILILFAAIFLSSCAGNGGILHNGSQDIGEDFLEETFDRTEDTGERMIGNLFNRIVKGTKKINVENRGCVAVKVSRLDGGEINGKPFIIIPPEDGGVISVKIGINSNERDEFVLQAKHIGSIPPGCRDIGYDSEEFDQDYDRDEWRIRLR